MTETERIKEWVHYYRVTERHYEMNALLAVLRNDGEKMLAAVLQELGLTRSIDLVKDAAKHDKGNWNTPSV